MTYNSESYNDIACAPNAPRTADVTAITILRSLSHQVELRPEGTIVPQI